MRRQHLTRRRLLRLVGGGLAVGTLGGIGQAAPVAHDGGAPGSNLIAGLESPDEEDSGEFRLLVAWEEQFNGRVVDAYPADRTGKQAPLWSRAQYRDRFPMFSARTLDTAFREQFLDIDALYGASGNQPLMDLTGIQPGDEGQLDLFVQPVGRDGIVGVTGRLHSNGAQQPQATAGNETGEPLPTATPAATTAMADAITAKLVQTGHTGVGEMTTVVLAEGTLREVLAAVGDRPVPLDGDLSTDTLDCTNDASVPHVRLTWRLPETASVAADDGARFDLRFTAVPCPTSTRPALSVTTRSYMMSSNRLVYIVRVRNDGPATARNVRVVPKREVGPTSQRTTIAGYGNCLLDPYDWLDVEAIRVRKGPTTSMLNDFSKGDAGGGLTYDQTYDPRTGIWHLGTVEPKQTWELLVTLNTSPCAAGQTFRNTVEVRTDDWWTNRLHDPAAWTATTETALD
ncbi:hypothetical protein [Haloarchaeobius sp. HME9146]|uniref:hypothetical protein n=1 Tax=Haloarchaeobius sp. HME9146 TaxID=2978732 RepID=UPI0021C23C04|nr:hypothetical protein [Haloarchaeobius sp. HME9146]MCT9096994.1 hypothetical protein [Haloarchaeobius sp. HME9146]